MLTHLKYIAIGTAIMLGCIVLYFGAMYVIVTWPRVSGTVICAAVFGYFAHRLGWAYSQ